MKGGKYVKTHAKIRVKAIFRMRRGLGRASWSEDAFSEAPSATFLTTVFMEVSSVFVTPKRKYSVFNCLHTPSS